MAIISRYVALDMRGVGSCPFKDHHYRGDMRPSFQVFDGNDPHWYCYTLGRGGDLFSFLCYYYNLYHKRAGNDYATAHSCNERSGRNGAAWAVAAHL